MNHEINRWKRIPGGRNIEFKSLGRRVPGMHQGHNGGQRDWRDNTGKEWPEMRSERGWDRFSWACRP